MNNKIQWIDGNDSEERIYRFLIDVDEILVPKLSARVNIKEYAQKISEFGNTLFISSQGEDLASCSIYCNTKNCYITSIAVKLDYQNRHLGKKLLSETKKYAKAKKCHKIILDVHQLNQRAIHFYEKNDFRIVEKEKEWIKMETSLRDNLIELKRTVLNITTFCNLKCKHCLAFIPYYKEKKSLTIEEAKEVLKEYFKVVDVVETFTITGGEPLLNKDLLLILEEVKTYKNQIRGTIDFVTNGTIEIPEDILSFFQNNNEKTRVVLSNYGEDLSKKINDIENQLISRKINYRISKFYGDDLYYDGWIDFTDQSLKWSSEEAREENAQKCLHRVGKYFVINEGELHSCSRGFWRIKNGITPRIKGEYIPLLDKSISIEEKRKDLVHMYSLKSSSFCAYCVGFRNGVPRVRPAEQLD